MDEPEKDHGFMNVIKDGLRDGLVNVSKIITASIFPPMVEGTELIIKKVEEKIIQMEKRIIKKLYSLLVIGFGAILLIFALIFFLIENLNWSKATAFFALGIIIFITGLILQISKLDSK